MPVLENEPLVTPSPEDLGPNVVARLEFDILVPRGVEDRPCFAEWAQELAKEGERRNIGEGEAAARDEAATGATLARPNPSDSSHDFVDQATGERVEVKGTLPEVNGTISDERVEGLIAATLKEANPQTGADQVVVDVSGLSDAQVDRISALLHKLI